ncbi:MAG: T9SS type A sorting domain-containing protein, partial [Candidatus Eisenbacteria bacterium]|nr:T9SS type A sorting domain-containing protein [Candidatus Eisenbacteria bacterium]
ALYARTSNGTEQLLAGSWLDAPHDFVIRWQPTFFDFSIDGTPVASIPFTVGSSLRPVISDLTTGVDSLTVDWIRLTPYATAGTFTSRVVDSGGSADWGTFAWGADTPSGTSISMSVRTGDTEAPDGSWTPFTPIGNGGLVGQSARYIQYRAALSTSDPTTTPVLREVTIECDAMVSGVDDFGDIRGVGGSLPSLLRPNPVTTSATFELVVSEEDLRDGSADVDVTIYDVLGREVRTLTRGDYGAGEYRLGWDVTDMQGRRLTPGVYFYRVLVGSREQQGELVVVK